MEHLLSSIETHARQHPGKCAVALQDDAVTYAAFWALSGGYWRLFDQAGLLPGDVIGCRLPDNAHRLACLVGTLRAGVVFVFIDKNLPPPAAREIAELAGAKAVIGDENGECGIRNLSEAIVAQDMPLHAHCSEDALCSIAFSSGTTGAPKGIPYRRSSLAFFAQLNRKHMLGGHKRLARFGQFWPPQMLSQLLAGETTEIYDLAKRGPEGMLPWLCERQIDMFSGYPAMFRAMVEDGGPLPPDLKTVFLIGEPLKQSDFEKFNRIAPPDAKLITSYGSMELPLISEASYRAGDPAPGTVLPMGRVLPEISVAILGPDGTSQPDFAVGEVVVETPHAPTEYFRDPKRSRRALKPSPVSGNWAFFTGDLAYRDTDGILHTVGRIDDQVKIRGYAVRTSHVEQAIQAHVCVTALAVVGVDGPMQIRRLVCCYEAAEPLDDLTLRVALAREMPGYMIPGRFIRLDALPRTDTGKILHRDLPNPFIGVEIPKTKFNGVAKDIATAWSSVLGHSDFGPEDDFFDAGGDSLQAMAMLLECEKATGVRTPFETLILDGASVASIAKRIEISRQGTASTLQRLNLCLGERRLFALHTIGGHLSDYLQLAAAMDPFLSLEGIHPRGLSGQENADSDIASLADHASDVILNAHGAEGINLIGFSAAGLFAYETARALMKKDAVPASLVMIDTQCGYSGPPSMLRSMARQLRQGNVTTAVEVMSDKVSGYFFPRKGQSKLTDAHFAALPRAQMQPLDLDRTLLLRANAGNMSDLDLDVWRQVLGDRLSVFECPGDHMSVLRGNNAPVLARRIADWLNDV